MATETEYTPVEAGDQYLYIQDATYYPDACHYDIEFKSLSNGAVFRIRYFMLTKEGKQNGFTGKVLHTLGKAINMTSNSHAMMYRTCSHLPLPDFISKTGHR